MTKRINIMTTWKEFNPTALKSMKDEFSDKPSPIGKEILT